MVRPWFVRAVDASPLSPVSTAVLLGGALLATNLLLFSGSGLDLLLYFPCAIAYLVAAGALCAHVLTQHTTKSYSRYEDVGKMLFGLPPSFYLLEL